MNCLRLIATLTLGFVAINVAALAQNHTEQVQSYLDDVDTLTSWVKNMHPLPFARSSESEWLSVIEDSKKLLIEDPSEFNMVLATADILNHLNDSHTGIQLGDWIESRSSITGTSLLKLTSTSDGFYVIKDGLGLLEAGTKVLEINGKPINEVFDLAFRFSNQEGNSLLSRKRIAELFLVEASIAQEDIIRDSVRIKIEDYFGVSHIIYPLLDKRESKKVRRTGSERTRNVEWVWENDFSERIVRLNINSFITGSAFKYFRHLNKGFRELIELEKLGEVDGLVIDIRDNWGGETGRMEYLFQFLTDEEMSVSNVLVSRQSAESKKEFQKIYRGWKKWVINKWGDDVPELQFIKRMSVLEIGNMDTLHYSPTKMGEMGFYEGPTVLLMDGTSISASVAFASTFIKLDRGVVFGEECMGPMTGTFANPIVRSLPNSKIKVVISTAQYSLAESLACASTPIQPHRWIQNNSTSIFQEEDPCDIAIEDWISAPEVSVKYGFQQRESIELFRQLETIYSENHSWEGATRTSVFNTIKLSDECISSLKLELKNIQSSNLPEEEILEHLLEINNSTKTCRENRNATIRLIIPNNLKKKFDELLAPGRPVVLHFGIHNRADCNICLPK